MVGTPILLEGTVRGVLFLAGDEAFRQLTRWEQEALELLGQQLAAALRNLRLFEEAEQRARRLALLNHSIDRMNRKLFEPELLDSMASSADSKSWTDSGRSSKPMPSLPHNSIATRRLIPSRI